MFRLDQWFPKWAVPSPGERWYWLGGGKGALEVGPSERVVRLYTTDQDRAKSETSSSLRL
jgi:hypothetical protein